MKIWQLDPANLTAYYDMALADALAKSGAELRFFSSRYLYENLSYPKTYQFEEWYFRGLDNAFLRQNGSLRQVLRGLSYPFGHWQLLQEAQREKPDIVHIQWSRLPIFDSWLIRQIKQLGIPIVHTVHDVVPIFSRMDTDGLGKVYALADALIVHSEANAKALLETYPQVQAQKVQHIPMIAYPDPENLPMPKGANQAEARRKLGIESQAKVVLFFGAMKRYKGIDILLEAMQGIDAEFWLVGAPDTEIAAELAGIQRPNLRLLTQYIPTEDVWAYHMAADLVVFPYRHIFQSAALITALSYGKAVIVSDVGGMPETISGNGWIVPPENPAALANALREAIANSEQLAVMGQCSREIIMTDYAPTAVAEKHLSLYRSLL